MNHEFVYKGENKAVELKDNRFASFPNSSNTIEIEYTPDGRLFLHNGTQAREIYAAVDGDKTFVDIDGVLYEFALPSQDASGAGGGAGMAEDPSKVFAPMPGKIVKIMVEVGNTVEPKQHLVIVEAMKMENIIIAQGKGKVNSINFSVGEQVDTDNPIIELELES